MMTGNCVADKDSALLKDRGKRSSQARIYAHEAESATERRADEALVSLIWNKPDANSTWSSTVIQQVRRDIVVGILLLLGGPRVLLFIWLCLSPFRLSQNCLGPCLLAHASAMDLLNFVLAAGLVFLP